MKLQININDDIVERIDEQAHALGVTRSALCAMWIGQGLRTMEANNDLTKAMSAELSQVLVKALGNLKLTPTGFEPSECEL